MKTFSQILSVVAILPSIVSARNLRSSAGVPPANNSNDDVGRQLTTMHDNIIQFVNHNGNITSAEMRWVQFYITPGQPHGSSTMTTQDGNQIIIDQLLQLVNR